MNKKLLLVCLVFLFLFLILFCECYLNFCIFCESIGINSIDRIGLVEVLVWGGLERDEF